MRISDWSSDVCSSDLAVDPGELLLEHLGDAVLDRFGRGARIAGADVDLDRGDIGILLDRQRKDRAQPAQHDDDRQHPGENRSVDEDEIGRAACRERVCQYVYISVVAGSLKNTKRQTYSVIL